MTANDDESIVFKQRTFPDVVARIPADASKRDGHHVATGNPAPLADSFRSSHERWTRTIKDSPERGKVSVDEAREWARQAGERDADAEWLEELADWGVFTRPDQLRLRRIAARLRTVPREPDVPPYTLAAAIRQALDELGVPQPGCPAPVANAVEILQGALVGASVAPEPCESCGKPISEHTDKWGRWESCVESIMDTVAFHEGEPAGRAPLAAVVLGGLQRERIEEVILAFAAEAQAENTTQQDLQECLKVTVDEIIATFVTK